MVQIEALTTPECQEGVPSPGAQQEGEQLPLYSWLCHSLNPNQNSGLDPIDPGLVLSFY